MQTRGACLETEEQPKTEHGTTIREFTLTFSSIFRWSEMEVCLHIWQAIWLHTKRSVMLVPFRCHYGFQPAIQLARIESVMISFESYYKVVMHCGLFEIEATAWNWGDCAKSRGNLVITPREKVNQIKLRYCYRCANITFVFTFECLSPPLYVNDSQKTTKAQRAVNLVFITFDTFALIRGKYRNALLCVLFSVKNV